MASVRPALMLLPGLLCDAEVWRRQREALAPVCECIVPNYGDCNSLGAMAALAIAQAPPGSLNVAGHSMGGRVAFEILRQAPERVERLALLDTSYHPLPPGPEGERERARRHALLARARTHGMREMGREWATGMVHPSRLGTALFETILDMIERSTPAMFAAQIEALLARPDATDLLGAVRCPTLVLCGREDLWSPLSRHEFIHQKIPGSERVVIDHCGHMSPMEQPRQVSAALRAWLTGPTAG